MLTVVDDEVDTVDVVEEEVGLGVLETVVEDT